MCVVRCSILFLYCVIAQPELGVHRGSAEAAQATLQNSQFTCTIAIVALMKTQLKPGRSLRTPTISYLITAYGWPVR